MFLISDWSDHFIYASDHEQAKVNQGDASSSSSAARPEKTALRDATKIQQPASSSIGNKRKTAQDSMQMALRE